MLQSKLLTFFLLACQIAGYAQWESKNIPTIQVLTSVDFLDNLTGFVTGGNFIFKTENGGDTWTTSYTVSANVFLEDIFAIDNEIIIAVGKDFDTNQSIIVRTTNGGAAWEHVPVAAFSLLRSVFFPSPNIGYCSGSGGTILKTMDAGISWQNLVSGTSANLQSIYFVNNMVGLAVGGSPASAEILKTQDGGTHWMPITSPSNNNLQSVYFSSPETGYIVGWNGTIIKTENCGDSWTDQGAVAMTGNLEVVFTDDNTGYVVGGASNESLIQKTTNGGAIWQDISPQIPQGLVCIHFPSFDTGYAVGANGTVLKTESGGVLTSTNDWNMGAAFKAFPNPSNGRVQVQTFDGRVVEILRVFDSNGKEIETVHPNAASAEIDFSDFVPGVYYLMVQCEGFARVQKMVVK